MTGETETEYTEEQQKVLDTLKPSDVIVRKYGERDTGFHWVIGKLAQSSQFRSNLEVFIPNLNALLNVTEEELIALPNFGARSVKHTLEIREKLLRNPDILRGLEAAIYAENNLRGYKLSYLQIIKHYQELREHSDRCTERLEKRWNARNG